ncbi:MAG: DUF1847 domain-containing protein [Methanoregula sp.]|jgi:uncharacterized metal-binding protein|uniref:DUF1847 domain-containing protein n=1 Tax=Methanoregula sp. TaxID=2052170 RepID=UPI003D0E41AB
MERQSPQCVKCTILRCGSPEKNRKVPASCPTEKYPDLVRETIDKFMLPENQAINQGWLALMNKVVDPEKPREKFSWTRVDEIIEYAKIRGMKRIGIATCYALMSESRSLSDILERNGFDVVSVSCLCGEVNPQDVGMPGDIFCNPIMQAEVLNREKTELNIMVGLCLGHDILFLRHCKAETTPLVVKDRALGHNPVAALYLNQGFFRDRFTRG